jgi:glycosyltransferase involved in cell wall biosynthesis
MANPTLSVVIPNYNHSAFLARALTALGEQSKSVLEVIVIDDGSTDNSVEIIKQFAAKFPVIKLHENGTNKGAHATVARGISLAKGDYLYFGAADDEVAAGLFEKSMALLQWYPQAALCCTIGDFREAATGVNWYWGVGIADKPCYLSPKDLVAVEKRGKLYIPPNSVVMKRSALLEVGQFDPELKFCCDWYAMYVAAFRHGICFVPEPLAIFHVQPNSYYHRIRSDQTEYSKTLERLMERLMRPENQGVVELIREGGSLGMYATPMLKVLLSRPEYRRFITPTFLRRNLSHSAKLFLKRHSPPWLVNWYLKFSSYGAGSANRA